MHLFRLLSVLLDYPSRAVQSVAPDLRDAVARHSELTAAEQAELS